MKKQLVLNFTKFARLAFVVLVGAVFLIGCGGGGGGGSGSSAGNGKSYQDGIEDTTVRTAQAGDYAVDTLTGTITLVSTGKSGDWTATIRSEMLSSTTEVNGATVNILRKTISQTLTFAGDSISDTSMIDYYFTQDASGNVYRYGEYNYDESTEKTVTSPAAGYYLVIPSPFDVGTIWDYSATLSDGSTDIGNGNVTGTANVSVPAGDYIAFETSYSYHSSLYNGTETGTAYYVPGLGFSMMIKQVATGSLTLEGEDFTFDATIETTESNVLLAKVSEGEGRNGVMNHLPQFQCLLSRIVGGVADTHLAFLFLKDKRNTNL